MNFAQAKAQMQKKPATSTLLNLLLEAVVLVGLAYLLVALF